MKYFEMLERNLNWEKFERGFWKVAEVFLALAGLYIAGHIIISFI